MTSNTDNIITRITSASSADEIERIIEQAYPGWLILSLENYCKDYPHFKTNWMEICRKLNTEPKRIVLVKDISFENPNLEQNQICDYLTKNGYVVRRAGEFIACSKCESAIPCIEVWSLLKEKNFRVPSVYSMSCSGCRVSVD